MDRSSTGWSLSGREVLISFHLPVELPAEGLTMTNYSTEDIRLLSRKRFPDVYASENRKSFVRACTAKVMTVRRKRTPLEYAQTIWHDDEIAQHMLKGIRPDGPWSISRDPSRSRPADVEPQRGIVQGSRSRHDPRLGRPHFDQAAIRRRHWTTCSAGLRR